MLNCSVCVSGPSDIPANNSVPSHAPVGGRAARVASTTGRLNAQHTTTSSPLPQRPKTVLDYRAALSSGNQPPFPYQAAFKSRPALGAPGTQLYAARQASNRVKASTFALSEAKVADLRLAAKKKASLAEAAAAIAQQAREAAAQATSRLDLANKLHEQALSDADASGFAESSATAAARDEATKAAQKLLAAAQAEEQSLIEQDVEAALAMDEADINAMEASEAVVAAEEEAAAAEAAAKAKAAEEAEAAAKAEAATKAKAAAAPTASAAPEVRVTRAATAAAKPAARPAAASGKPSARESIDLGGEAMAMMVL